MHQRAVQFTTKILIASSETTDYVSKQYSKNGS